MEDLDRPRCVPGAADTILRQLENYGLIWDGAVLAQSGRDAAYATALQQLREAGIRVLMHASTVEGLSSIKSQFKKADASGAAYALIFGSDELARGEVTVKPLRDGGGVQQVRLLAEVAAWAITLQSLTLHS